MSNAKKPTKTRMYSKVLLKGPPLGLDTIGLRNECVYKTANMTIKTTQLFSNEFVLMSVCTKQLT